MYFHTNKSVNRKILVSTATLLVFAGGLLVFLANKNMFSNYKTYYLESYYYIAPYKIKQLIAAIQPLRVSGRTTSTSPYAESVPVLVYHGVLGGNPDSNNGEATNIELSNFWNQMKTLKENGWQTVSIQDFYDFKRGVKSLPAKSFLLTFDDGRKDSYYPTNPILKALGFHAVMFVIDQYSLEENSDYYLTREELVSMSKSKEWELQSHGYSSHSEYTIDSLGNTAHFFSNKLWLPELSRIETEKEFIDRIRNDLEKSKVDLEDAINKRVTAFAFPFGDYGEGAVNFLDSESVLVPNVLDIYQMAFYQYSGVYRYSQNYPEPGDADGRYMIRRIGMSAKWENGEYLLGVLESGSAKTLPFTAKFDTTDGWVDTTWGKMEVTDGKMTIGASPDSTGSTVVLDGTNSWKDYSVVANVRWTSGSNIYLESRYEDDDNLTACNFKRGDRVHVEQTVDGISRVIAGVENKFQTGNGIFRIGMKVSGRNVECSINGEVIVSTPFLDESLSSGGVGLKTWDAIPGNSELIVEDFSVNKL